MSETQALGQNLPWIRWIISHADLVPSLLGLLSELQSAEGLRAKYEALKGIGDLLIDALGDAPIGVQSIVAGDVAALVAADTQVLELRLGDGALLKRLMDNLPQIISIVTTLVGLLGK